MWLFIKLNRASRRKKSLLRTNEIDGGYMIRNPFKEYQNLK